MTLEPLNKEETYDKLRRATMERLALLLDNRPVHTSLTVCSDITAILENVEHLGRHEAEVVALIYQIYHELYLERIIFPGNAIHTSASSPMGWPTYQFTDHGRRVLQTREYSPYDPDGYLRRLKEEIPDIDDTIVRYAGESLHCLKTDCLLAAAVTIGCASEKAMLLLIERFGEAISDPTKKDQYAKDTGSWMIFAKYKAFRKYLDGVAHDMPKELRGLLDSQLHGIFDLIRRTRNEAGHPTGDPIPRDSVLANHIVFPGYCRYVYALMARFGDNGAGI